MPGIFLLPQPVTNGGPKQDGGCGTCPDGRPRLAGTLALQWSGAMKADASSKGRVEHDARERLQAAARPGTRLA